MCASPQLKVRRCLLTPWGQDPNATRTEKGKGASATRTASPQGDVVASAEAPVASNPDTVDRNGSFNLKALEPEDDDGSHVIPGRLTSAPRRGPRRTQTHEIWTTDEDDLPPATDVEAPMVNKSHLRGQKRVAKSPQRRPQTPPQQQNLRGDHQVQRQAAAPSVGVVGQGRAARRNARIDKVLTKTRVDEATRRVIAHLMAHSEMH